MSSEADALRAILKFHEGERSMDGSPDGFSADGEFGRPLWQLLARLEQQQDLADQILGELDELDTYDPEVVLSSIRHLCERK